MKKKNARALVLFSGGLDSILAAKILMQQGIDVTALTFAGHFFGAEQAEKSAAENGIKLRIENFHGAHLNVVKKPRFGRGSGMNPCIDCHLLMLKAAKILAGKENFDVIATGEVLGQRPMSQNVRALNLIEKEAGLAGKILRPLSSNALPETNYEKAGLVDRAKLPGISGRSRKCQIELAKKFRVENFPSPAGGCILTDKEYSKKLLELLEKIENPNAGDIALLRAGRHFWDGETKIILGRNHEENLAIKERAEHGDIVVEPKGFSGPTAIVRGKNAKDLTEFAQEKIIEYSKKIETKKPEFTVREVVK